MKLYNLHTPRTSSSQEFPTKPKPGAHSQTLDLQMKFAPQSLVLMHSEKTERM